MCRLAIPLLPRSDAPMLETPRLTRRSALALGAVSAAILAEARAAAPAPSGPLTALPAHDAGRHDRGAQGIGGGGDDRLSRPDQAGSIRP